MRFRRAGGRKRAGITTIRSDERPPAGVATALSRPVATAIGLLATIRRARAFHPVGSARRSTVTIDAGDHPLAPLAGTHDGVVRTSRGAGLPAVLPDVHGIALRLLPTGTTGAAATGAAATDLALSTCDLLLSSAGPGRLLRHVLRPGWDPARPTYSSLAPYADATGRRFVVGARATEEDEVRLLVARPGESWRAVGTVVLGPEIDDAEAERLRFDPFTCPPGIEPVGWLNDLRRPAYRASQARRPT